MKKIFAFILLAAVTLSFFAFPSSAMNADEIGELKYTLLMQSSRGVCHTAMENLTYARYTMRGMAVSSDGKYLFGGYLNPGGASAIEMFSAETGELISGVQFYQVENTLASFPKGLATDDRGILYAALAYNPNESGRADLATYTYENGELEEHGWALLTDLKNNTKVGVNGITVEKIDGKYYAYVVINYELDLLARVDVTDPAKPKLDLSFGENGLIDLSKAPFNIKDANYLDVDSDGRIYLSASASTTQLLVISSDGRTVEKTADFKGDKAYGVALYKDHVLVSIQNTGKVVWLNKSDLSLAGTAEITRDNIVMPYVKAGVIENQGVFSICNISVVDDILYLGDQGGEGTYDQIFAAGLTNEARIEVGTREDSIAKRLIAFYEPASAPVTTTPATEPPVTEPPVTEPPATEPPVTEPPATEPPVTEAPKTDAPITDAPAAQSGCGSFANGGALIMALLASFVLIKKREEK